MLHLNFSPSRQLAALLLMLHLIAIGCVLSVVMPALLQAGLICVIAVSGLCHWTDQAARRLPWSIVALTMEPEGGIVLQQRNQKIVEGRIRDGSFIAPWMTVLRYTREDKFLPRTLIILPDALPQEMFRQLRVRLKWLRPQAQALI